MFNSKITSPSSPAKLPNPPEKNSLGQAKETIQRLLEQGADEADILQALNELKKGLPYMEGRTLTDFAKEGLKCQRQIACTGIDMLDEKTLAKYLEKVFNEMHEADIKQEIKKHCQRMAESLAKGIEASREKKLVAFSAMGLAMAAPPKMSSEVASMIKRLETKAKDLLIPDLSSVQATPILDQTLGQLLKGKHKNSREMVAIALLLAQMGVPEETLAKMAEKQDLKGLQHLFSGFTPQANATPQLSINPMERIRQMAE